MATTQIGKTTIGLLDDIIRGVVNTTGKTDVELIAQRIAEETNIPYADALEYAARQVATPAAPIQRQGVGKVKPFAGAPRNVTNEAQAAQMRSDYMDLANLGQAGRDWYKESSNWINRTAPGSQQSIADIIGITSQGTGVDANLGFTVKGVNQAASGMPVNTGRFPSSQSPLIEYALQGDRAHLGPKRQPFADNLSMAWNPQTANTAVHDIWQGRAFGYTHPPTGKFPEGKPWDAGFSPQQHAFMDEQTAIIERDLNKNAIGGFTDWDAKNTQAAAWTGAKIKAGEVSPEDAAMHYGDFSPKYQTMATYEQVPGANTGYLEGIVDAPYDTRAKYSGQASWMNDKGQDAIYTSGGLITEPTQSAVGAYTPASTGVLEINPANVARPLVTTEGGVIRPNESNLLDMTESARAYVDVQNAGAWHKLIPDSQTSVGERTSLSIPMSKSPTKEQMAQISAIAEKNGFFAVDTGKGVNLINDIYNPIGEARTGVTLGKDLKGALGDDLKSLKLGEAKRTKIQTGYEDYETAWQSGTGSGEATSKFLTDLSKNEVFGRSIEPALRVKAGQNLERDIKFAQEQGMPIRDDIVTALTILRDEGVAGLKKAVDNGVILPALVGSILSPAVIGSLAANGGSQKGT